MTTAPCVPSGASEIDRLREKRENKREGHRFQLWKQALAGVALLAGGIAGGGYLGTKAATSQPLTEAEQKQADEHLRAVIGDALKPFGERMTAVETRYEYLFRKAEVMQSVLNSIQGELLPDVKGLARQLADLSVVVGRIDERTKRP